MTNAAEKRRSKFIRRFAVRKNGKTDTRPSSGPRVSVWKRAARDRRIMDRPHGIGFGTNGSAIRLQNHPCIATCYDGPRNAEHSGIRNDLIQPPLVADILSQSFCLDNQTVFFHYQKIIINWIIIAVAAVFTCTSSRLNTSQPSEFYYEFNQIRFRITFADLAVLTFGDTICHGMIMSESFCIVDFFCEIMKTANLPNQ